jgi:hypothetical protein
LMYNIKHKKVVLFIFKIKKTKKGGEYG